MSTSSQAHATPLKDIDAVSPSPIVPMPPHSLGEQPKADALCQTYDKLQRRFGSGATQSLDYRVYNLKQLAYLVKENETKIQACLRKDLDRGEFDTEMTEVSCGDLVLDFGQS